MTTNDEFRAAVEKFMDIYDGEDADEDNEYYGAGFDKFIVDTQKGTGVFTIVGWVTHVEDGSYLDTFEDKVLFHIFKAGEQYFRVEGWYNSWSDDGGWNHDEAFEVVQQAVTRYEYLRK